MFFHTAGSNVYSITREYAVSVGVIERGECNKVFQTYLGGLTVSVVANGKAKQSLVNGARFMGCQKSDYLIVVTKCMKVHGVKGVTNQQSSKGKHAKHRRLNTAWNEN